jgi:hypothetical protein
LPPDEAIDVSEDALELMVEPLELAPVVLPDVLPVLAEPVFVLPEDAAPAVAPPAGVPVVPIGVPCELCWPAPTGALLTAGLGGLPWAIAVPIRATVATPASRPLSWFDAVIVRTPCVDLFGLNRLLAGCVNTKGGQKS